MAKSTIRITVPLSLEETFKRLSDHANLNKMIDQISQAELITAGKNDQNGLGAVRKIKFNSDLLTEEIIKWIPLTDNGVEAGYDYKVISNNKLIADHLGVLRITKENDQSSRIAWDIYLKVPLWAMGEIAAYFVCKTMEKELTESLRKNFTLE